MEPIIVPFSRLLKSIGTISPLIVWIFIIAPIGRTTTRFQDAFPRRENINR